MCAYVSGELQECFEKFGRVRHARIITVSNFTVYSHSILIRQ